MMDLLKQLFERVTPTDHQQRALGEEAQRVYESPAIQRALQSVRIGIYDKWGASPIADLEGQAKLRMMLKLLDDLEGNLKLEINKGLMADRVIKDREEKANRVKIVNIRR